MKIFKPNLIQKFIAWIVLPKSMYETYKIYGVKKMREPEAKVKEFISDYLITGNLEAFVTNINAHYNHRKGLKGYIKYD